MSQIEITARLIAAGGLLFFAGFIIGLREGVKLAGRAIRARAEELGLLDETVVLLNRLEPK